MRERLIELLLEVDNICDISECVECVTKNCGTYRAADHLIENGLVFATDNHVGGKWIPVTERLPDRDSTVLAFYETMRGTSAAVQVTKGWNIYGTATHWMPLPPVPKEGA